jgi:hypothetical protein
MSDDDITAFMANLGSDAKASISLESFQSGMRQIMRFTMSDKSVSSALLAICKDRCAVGFVIFYLKTDVNRAARLVPSSNLRLKRRFLPLNSHFSSKTPPSLLPKRPLFAKQDHLMRPSLFQRCKCLHFWSISLPFNSSLAVSPTTFIFQITHTFGHYSTNTTPTNKFSIDQGETNAKLFE